MQSSRDRRPNLVRAAQLAAALALACAALLGSTRAPLAQAVQCQSEGNALGVSRIITIETAGGPRFGTKHYGDYSFLLRKGEVVLTFDDGPGPATVDVLAALRRHCTLATFFLVGKHVMKYPQIALQIAEQGHTVAAHSWSNKRQTRRTGEAAARQEIDRGFSAISSVVPPEKVAPFFRYPGFLEGPGMKNYLERSAVAAFSIDVDSNDYNTASQSEIVDNVLRGLDEHKKGIVVFHDAHATTAQAIPLLLDRLKERRYHIVHLVPSKPYRAGAGH